MENAKDNKTLIQEAEKSAPPSATETADFGELIAVQSKLAEASVSPKAPRSPPASTACDSDDAMSVQSARSAKNDKVTVVDEMKEREPEITAPIATVPNSIIPRAVPKREGPSGINPHKYKPTRREWVWTGSRGWIEAGVDLRHDRERRRIWEVIQKGRQGRKQREKHNAAIATSYGRSRDESRSSRHAARSSYRSDSGRMVKRASSDDRSRRWQSSRW